MDLLPILVIVGLILVAVIAAAWSLFGAKLPNPDRKKRPRAPHE